MTQRVLVAIDGSAPATAALEHALSRFTSSDVTVLHVIDAEEDDSFRRRLLPDDCDAQREAAERAAETVLGEARAHADACGAAITTVSVVGRPMRRIPVYAEENDVDVIVMGTHGRTGLSRLLLGSLSEAVVRRSAVPVTTVRDTTDDDRIVSASFVRDREHPGETAQASPALHRCPECTVTLYTRLEFCPGCLGEFVPTPEPTV
jgi:nucleotide-binding universal stress UspA family protein